MGRKITSVMKYLLLDEEANRQGIALHKLELTSKSLRSSYYYV